jgi:hypothetical protein
MLGVLTPAWCPARSRRRSPDSSSLVIRRWARRLHQARELHPWNASVDDIERPDRLVFDLDPGEGVAWEFVIETALRLRWMLKYEGVEPWPKLTGGEGLHLMAPLDGTMDHDQARAYAKPDARRLAATASDRYALSSVPEKARRAHLHRLPAERPRHDGHRCLVAAGAGWIPHCGSLTRRTLDGRKIPSDVALPERSDSRCWQRRWCVARPGMRRSEEHLHGELDEVDVFGRTGFLDEASGEEMGVDGGEADMRIDLPSGIEGELVTDVAGVAPRARTQELTARIVDPVLGF